MGSTRQVKELLNSDGRNFLAMLGTIGNQICSALASLDECKFLPMYCTMHVNWGPLPMYPRKQSFRFAQSTPARQTGLLCRCRGSLAMWSPKSPNSQIKFPGIMRPPTNCKRLNQRIRFTFWNIVHSGHCFSNASSFSEQLPEPNLTKRLILKMPKS